MNPEELFMSFDTIREIDLGSNWHFGGYRAAARVMMDTDSTPALEVAVVDERHKNICYRMHFALCGLDDEMVDRMAWMFANNISHTMRMTKDEVIRTIRKKQEELDAALAGTCSR